MYPIPDNKNYNYTGINTIPFNPELYLQPQQAQQKISFSEKFGK